MHRDLGATFQYGLFTSWSRFETTGSRRRSGGNCGVAYVVDHIGSVAGKKGKRFAGERDRNLGVYYSDLKEAIETIVSSSFSVSEDWRLVTRQARGKKDSFWVGSGVKAITEPLRISGCGWHKHDQQARPCDPKPAFGGSYGHDLTIMALCSVSCWSASVGNFITLLPGQRERTLSWLMGPAV